MMCVRYSWCVCADDQLLIQQTRWRYAQNDSDVWLAIIDLLSLDSYNKNSHINEPDVLVRKNTSPKAPRPIIVSGSKSSTHSFCLCNLICSVSFLSRSFITFWWSSSETHASLSFRSRVHLLSPKKRWKTAKHTNSLNIYQNTTPWVFTAY